MVLSFSEHSKSKYGGMETNDVKRLKELENTRLKKLFAEVSLENNAMKEFFANKKSESIMARRYY
jgi:putative transposase